MKNLFGLQFREDLEKDILDGTPFESARVSMQQEQLLENIEEEKEDLYQKAKLPLVLRIIMQIGFYMGGLLFVSDVFGILNRSFEQVWNDTWYLVIAAVILLAVSLALFLMQRKKSREARKIAQETMLEERTQRLEDASRKELGIPESAVHIDVIQTSYELMDGEEEAYGSENNISLYAYCQDDSLCFANTVWVFKIPFSSIQKVVWVKEQKVFYHWNKEEPCNSKTYKPYHVKKDNGATYTTRGYYSLRISEARGEFEVMVPEYDEKVLFSLLPPQIPKEGF